MEADPSPQFHLPRLPRWAVIRDARRRQRRRRAIVLVAAVGVAGLAVLLTPRSHAGSRDSSPAPSSRLSTVRVGGYIGEARAAGGHIWVLTCVYLCGAADTGLDEEQLVEVDATGGRVIRRLSLPDVSAFTTIGRSLWVAHFLSGEVTRVDPANGSVTARVALRLPASVAPNVRAFLPTAMSTSAGQVWVSTARGWIAEIDPRSGTLVQMIRTPSEDNASATDHFGTWVAENLDGVGWLAPHRTHLRIRAILQGGRPLDVQGVFSDGPVVWAVAFTTAFGTPARTVAVEIDPRTDRIIRRVQTPDTRGAVVADGALYLGALDQGHIYRVSRAGGLTRLDTVRRDAVLAASSPGRLWVTTNARPGHLVSIRLAPAREWTAA